MTVQRDHVDIVQSKEFDVVSSDIGLPDGSGYDVISEAKRKQPVKGVAILYPTRTKASGEAKEPASIFTSPKRWTSTRCAGPRATQRAVRRTRKQRRGWNLS